MHKIFIQPVIGWFCTLFVLCVCIGCNHRQQDDRPVLTVSIEPLRYVVEAVAGDKYRVAVLSHKEQVLKLMNLRPDK